MKGPRFRIRTLLLAVALATIVVKWAVVPAWNYYSLPPTTRSVLGRLGRPLRMPPSPAPSLADLLKATRLSTPDDGGVGIPIYLEPSGLEASGADLNASIGPPRAGASVATALEESLRPIGLGYYVEDGLLRITSARAADRAVREKPREARRP